MVSDVRLNQVRKLAGRLRDRKEQATVPSQDKLAGAFRRRDCRIVDLRYTLSAMSPLLRGAALLLCLSVVATAGAQEAPSPPQATAANQPGREILQRKCAQCHAASMWMPLRQDRRAWESTLYRMVGRGALWTPEEIGAMADYLAQLRGPSIPLGTAPSTAVK